MKLTINTTHEQDSAITEANATSNAGGILPSDEDFAVSHLESVLNDLVTRQVSTKSSEIQAELSKLDAVDLVDVKALVDAKIAAK